MLMPGAVNFFAQMPVAHPGENIGIVYAFWHSNVAGKAVIALLVLGLDFQLVGDGLEDLHDPPRPSGKRGSSSSGSAPRASRWPFTRTARPIPIRPTYAVYLAGCRELTFHLLGTTEIDDTFSTRVAEADRISPVAMNAVRSRPGARGGRAGAAPWKTA